MLPLQFEVDGSLICSREPAVCLSRLGLATRPASSSLYRYRREPGGKLALGRPVSLALSAAVQLNGRARLDAERGG
jgi:hypothetical protein